MLNWKGYNWLQNERWGFVHPEKSDWWYDSNCSFVDTDGNLNLLTKKNQKYFPEIDKISSIGVGLVSCTERFKWGRFEIEAKLPYGENLWPAFWMWSWDSWPPEIDVFEGYSDKNSNFFKLRISKLLGFWNVQTNIHYVKEGKNRMIGGKTHYFGFKDPTKNFIKYAVDWKKDRVNFYYNDKIVRSIKDKLILEQLNNTSMNVVINNGVTSDVNLEQPPLSNFIIKDFKYTKY